MANWYQNAIFYELHVRAFNDSNGDGHGDLAGLRQKLDYLQWLGVDCIWLLPINASPLKDDGYDVASYYTIHPTFGFLEEFKLLLEDVHARGMKLIVDMVMNHTSDEHPWFIESKRSKDSPLRDWYVWSDTTEKYKDARIIFTDSETSNWAYSAETGEYYWHRFYSAQPDLNYDNPAVQQAMMDVVRFWLDMGVDGFRLDAIANLYEREGTTCENLPETHAFIKEMRRFVEANYDDRVLLGEVNQWPRDLLAYFGDDGQGGSDELHMCFHFPVMPRLYMGLAMADNTSIIDILNDTPTLPNGAQWATFLRNHDELSLEMVTKEEHAYMWSVYAPKPEMRFGLGVRRRLAPLLGGDVRKIALMHSMLLTLPGTPVLYYGDEIGMGDNVKLPDRNGVRTPMQWNSESNGGFSFAPAAKLYAPVIADKKFGFAKINVEAQQADPDSLLNTVRGMITARKANPALQSGALVWMAGAPKETLCFTRGADDGQQYTTHVLHNLSDQPQQVKLPDGLEATDIFTTERVSGEVTLAPYAWRWLRG
ncbi:MAG: maltose alpha-D-glucosyltransferase [Pleurocapsa minor GSE-CHR-MK-17-07R]|jgi:maltose alpha-D-glucosyltransferase/alpha-amylase|nr:maltose alpha-D-glucosyltransferase [Pleurocapsa minor GSE-CHR-MK 17-07R]